MITDGIYDGWASVYESFERQASVDTWSQGIVRELRRLGCDTHRILDLGAGTGIGGQTLRAAFPACEVVSLDQSRKMLERGGVPPDLQVVGDMARFSVEAGGFDFVVSGFDALNYLSKPLLADCFECVATALTRGGHLVFDYSSRKLLKHDWGALDLVREQGDVQLHVRHRDEPLTERTRIELELMSDGTSVWRERHFHYAADPFDIYELGLAHGLQVLGVRDIGADTFTPTSTTHVYVLQLN